MTHVKSEGGASFRQAYSRKTLLRQNKAAHGGSAFEGHKEVQREREISEEHEERTEPPSGGVSEVGAVLLSADPRTSRRSAGVLPSHVVQRARGRLCRPTGKLDQHATKRPQHRNTSLGERRTHTLRACFLQGRQMHTRQVTKETTRGRVTKKKKWCERSRAQRGRRY